MESHPRVRKKRRDVKIHYIRRGNNIFILPNEKGERKENGTIQTHKKP